MDRYTKPSGLVCLVYFGFVCVVSLGPGSTTSLVMGYSFWFDVCVFGCCEGGIKGDDGWFCWSNEVCWA